MAKEKVVKDNSERWLLTYADLMNLLLILFIILYAMSQVDQAKYDQLSSSLKSAFGMSSNTSMLPPGGGGNSLVDLPADLSSPVIPAGTEEQRMESVKDRVKELIHEEKMESDVAVKLEERGIVISITAHLLFKPASADIEPDSKFTIERIGKILKEISGNHIRVEGHTDSDPLISSSLYPTNWELSSARATNVVRLLIERAEVEPKSISAVGYGEYRPVAPNDTPENKAKNRRVDIVILKSAYDNSEPDVKPVR